MYTVVDMIINNRESRGGGGGGVEGGGPLDLEGGGGTPDLIGREGATGPQNAWGILRVKSRI